MTPALIVGLCWALFGLSHIGLTTGRLRAALVTRLGTVGFLGTFSLVAAAAFTLVIRVYAAYRLEGLPGLTLGTYPLIRGVCMFSIGAGVTLAVAALAAYPRSPMAPFDGTVRAPYGLERVTRHPFFVGMVLLAIPHCLLAPHLVGIVFALGLAVIAAVGLWHQDRKLLALRGAPYAAYLAATSVVPFAAIVSGRQRLVWGELPIGAGLAGVAIAAWLRAVHGAIFAHGGTWVIGVTIGGAALASLQAWRRARRRGLGLTPRAA